MELSQSISAAPGWRKLAPFGAEVENVDLASADDDTLGWVVDLFGRNGALVVRGQNLTPDDLVRFVARFGEPQRNEGPHKLEGNEVISILSNRVVDGKPLGAHNDGVGWHTDLSFKERPALCTLLYALEVPDEGSDTLLADGCASYDELPEERKAELGRIGVLNSHVHFIETREHNRRKATDEDRARFPDVVHPLVRTHPVNGRKALWPTTGTTKDVLGAPEGQDGFAILNEVVEHMTQGRFVYRHKWQVGDVLLWDNRCSLHTGTLFDDSKYFRTMYRLWVEGDRPV
ncbi:TauD/TfdA family dioxygenase [Novosphingobium sp. AP12]|uniref:TauD/TfdA dioxygenase family protein n=1 Tax=Novosphingobium sp. AP12 TaxID=1144305 RepID=UPI000271E23D|nr:TauD/TfdA family dioxygenase [Novosphingobium sp. AP12]EJL31621.1 putative taurine catabolism dioxygenase [Novosphingobium sp. AP12]